MFLFYDYYCYHHYVYICVCDYRYIYPTRFSLSQVRGGQKECQVWMGKWGQSTGFSDNYSIFRHILLGRPPFRPPKPSILAPPWSLPRRQKDDNRCCCPISRLPQQHLLRSLRMAVVDTTCLYLKISFMTDPDIGWLHTVNANLYSPLDSPVFIRS